MNPTARDLYEAREHAAALAKKLDKQTALHQPPSLHVKAWRDYERAYFAEMGRHPASNAMGYNLWTDAARGLVHAHTMLTDDDFRKRTGRTKRTAPRWALAGVARAIGYRYQRGLEVIEGELKPSLMLKFRREREAFLREFNRCADAAHCINDAGQNPDAALEVVMLLKNELLALCPWLEKTGSAQGAALLRDACGSI